MTAYVLPNYAGGIWNALKAGLSYTNGALAGSTPEAQQALVNAMTASLKYGLNAIEGDLFYAASSQNFINLSPVTTLTLTLDAATSAFMTNRINALQAAVLSIQTLSQSYPPQFLVAPVLNIPQALLSGLPIFPDPQYLEWLMGFNFEIPPAGLTIANFAAQAQSAAAAWAAIALALQTQGVVYNGATLNAVNQMGDAAQVTANAVANIAPLSSVTSLSIAWNILVVAPTLTRFASLVYNDPTSLPSQNTSVVRYVILQLLNSYNAMLVTLRQSTHQDVKMATVRQGDSLMDIAARELGDYSQWYLIAQINGLVPPFIGPQSGPGIAAQGQQIFMPTDTSVMELSEVPNYLLNYLGVDIYYGPLNGDMIAWTGDFNVISGYQNLSFSLGRRLQTTLGDLIYHQDFGSRVPPEVGAIAGAQEAGHIQAYTESALMSDPRVSKIVAINVTTQAPYAIVVNSTVLPNGVGASETTLNVVLGPA